MKLPLAWLQRYLPKLPSVSKLMDVLMMHGLEVEAVIDHSRDFDNVVVGEILAIKPHPNADKLQLAEVATQAKGAAQEIVCGAPNIAVGQKVPVALLGAKLPNGLTIEKRAIRGVESNGMICAEDELGLGKHHAGVLVLDASLKVGTPLAKALGLDQPVLDLAIPANRSDLMSVRGLAWEIGAMFGKTAKFPETKLVEASSKNPVSVRVTDPKLCSLYSARTIRGVKLQSSPMWLQAQLWAAGMRPINAVVDVTNYVMLLYGQPLHAFDANLVNGAITVRTAQAKETLVTLDGETRQLNPSMLIIADAAGPIALAGVKGGQSTGVTDATTDIILESAIFDSVSIRKTSRKLGLISEASKRYEKGLWPSLTMEASRVAAAMIADMCGGSVEPVVVVGNAKTEPRTVSLNPNYIPERLGLKVSTAKSKTILSKLGFTVSGTSTWNVIIPDWRPDVSLAEDIVDEIGRMVGYEKVPDEMPTIEIGKEIPQGVRFQEELKNILADMGFTEVISHAFYSAKEAAKVEAAHFEVSNPLDAEQQMLRNSLKPQIVETLKRQANAGADAMIFEIGLVFNPERSGAIDRQQYRKLALGITHKGEGQLNQTQQIFQDKLGTKLPPQGLSIEGPERGRMIEFCEFDLHALMAAANLTLAEWNPDQHAVKNVRYRELSKFPAVTRDIAFWWPKQESDIAQLIDGLGIELLKEYSQKDTFTKDGRTSYAYTFVYQSPDRTLTKTEVDGIEKTVKQALEGAGATIR